MTLPSFDFCELSRLEQHEESPPSFECDSGLPLSLPVMKSASTVAFPSISVYRWNQKFSMVFSRKMTLTNYFSYSWEEKNSVITSLMANRITEFLTESLTMKTSPLTINSLIFLLEMWIKVKGAPPESLALRAFYSQFTNWSREMTRGELVKFLTDHRLFAIFSPEQSAFMATRVLSDAELKNLTVPRTWVEGEVLGEFEKNPLFFLSKI